MRENVVDLRSDTVTLPTDEMRAAMQKAEVGDSQMGEDPTVNRLEAMAAEMMGKEAALFVVSGTMGNLVCQMAHTHPGDEVIFDPEAHIYYYEAGGFASLAGLSPRLLSSSYGVMDPADIEAAIRPLNVHYPIPRLLCLENTHNRRGGAAIRPEEIATMSQAARRHGLAVHLDGARIFNAAIALGVDVRELTQHVDSVMFCLSKGLSAPVGSLIAGSGPFIERGRGIRKRLGGDMRQSGVLAAAGLVALETMVDRLATDHRNAALLAAGLRRISGLVVDVPPIPTNMVYVEPAGLGISVPTLEAKMKDLQILAEAFGPKRLRMVTHRHITAEGIERTIAALQRIAAGA